MLFASVQILRLLCCLALAVSPGESRIADDLSSWLSVALKEQDWLTSVRRLLHRFPELCYRETRTNAIILEVLESIGIDTSNASGWGAVSDQEEDAAAKDREMESEEDLIASGPPPGKTGVVIDLGSGKSPCVALRSDIDGLPILEGEKMTQLNVSDATFRDILSAEMGKLKKTPPEVSEHSPSMHHMRMHACGHDGHMAMLLGAAKILKNRESEWKHLGTIRLIFQPAEEGGAGAWEMIKEGVLSKRPVVASVFGLHLWPALPSRTFATKAGPIMAGAACFSFRVEAGGGHAAMPHLTRDAVVAASAIVTALQTIVSRELDPLESGVVSVTSLESSSTTHNILPASVELKGTVRSLSLSGLDFLQKRVIEVARATAAVFECSVRELNPPGKAYIPAINHAGLAEAFEGVVDTDEDASWSFARANITMGGEDFAFYAKEVPSLFALLGQGSGPETQVSLHNPHFAMDESVLPYGVAAHIAFALFQLRQMSLRQPEHVEL